MREEDIAAAARDMSAQMPELWSDAESGELAALAALLARAGGGERVGEEILVLLTERSVTREELARRLNTDADTIRAVGDGGYEALPGYGVPAGEIVYACAVCGYAYPIFEVGEPVPDDCPHGHGPLARVA
jgi:hypothetical protein